MKALHYFIVSIVLMIGLALFVVFGNESSKDKIVYVKIQKIFEEFEGTTEYRRKIEALNGKQKIVLDSMRLEVLALVNSRGEEDEVVLKKKEYYNIVFDEFSRNKAEQATAFDQKIWSQINQFIADFGKEHTYKMIHGTKGDGGMMYAAEELDITEEVIEYINNAYQGN